MIKIIFCDMDGTLLTSENKLPEGFDEMMSELARRGVIFAPASGRQFFSLIRSFEKYRDDFLFLAENGTLVMYRGKEIFSQPLGVDAAKKVLAASMSFGNILRVYCGKKDAYILREQNTPEFAAELEKYYTHSGIVDNFDEVNDTPLKVALFDPTGNSKKNIFDKLTQFYSSLQVVLSSDYWVDIMSPNISNELQARRVRGLRRLPQRPRNDSSRRLRFCDGERSSRFKKSCGLRDDKQRPSGRSRRDSSAHCLRINLR